MRAQNNHLRRSPPTVRATAWRVDGDAQIARRLAEIEEPVQSARPASRGKSWTVPGRETGAAAAEGQPGRRETPSCERPTSAASSSIAGHSAGRA